MDDLIKKAESGDPDAQYNLGWAYATGDGSTEQDYALSRKWYTKAADQGCYESAYDVGTMYLDGTGGDINKEKGLHYLDYASTASLAASKLLMEIYAEGSFGIKPSQEKSEYYKNLYIKQSSELDD